MTGPVRNPVRDRLLAGAPAFGTMAFEFFTPGLVAVLAAAGADFVILDMEHSGAGTDIVRQQIACARGTGVVPMVRVPGLAYEAIAPVLDAGALGIMVPRIETPEEARELVACCRYRPQGRRGLAFSVAHDAYRGGDPVTLMRAADAAVLTIALVETATGIENIEAIAATPGIDVCWLGHFDLTDSQGRPGDFASSAFREAARRLADACRSHGKAAGFMDTDPALLDHMVALGYRAVGYGTDVVLLREALRSGLGALAARFDKGRTTT